MSSANRSRGPPNPGTEPTEELGYPALVQYTFVPNDTESSEILVSEGDIVQLIYKVGGWVFVKTYDGKVGYIPFSFCKELESSKEVSLSYKENEQTKYLNSNGIKTSQNDRFLQFNTLGRERFRAQGSKSAKRVTFADQPKNRNSCDICRNFLTSFSNRDHNLTSTEKKIKLKPHKLLKLLQTFSKEGFVSCGHSKSANNTQSHFGQIFDNRITRRVNSAYEFPIKFGNFCNQCDVLKDIFKNTNRYSMSDIYSTIRNLHSHAVTDSDSDQDDVSEESEAINNPSKNGIHVHVIPTGQEKIPKRSISFKDNDPKPKVEILRNNSFNGITESERCEFVNNLSSSEVPSKGNYNIQNGTNSEIATETRKQVPNGNTGVPVKSAGFLSHRINNYFSDKQESIGPPVINGFEEDVTDFRSGEYHPPLINKWRPANDGLSPTALQQRPPGIVREPTFEFESMKSREVNFNDPKKENLNLTKGNANQKGQPLVKSFTMDSRRKPLVTNGDFSLDDDNSLESTPNGYKQGPITKCFTTYGHSGGTTTGKSLTLDRHFKTSSQYSDHQNPDKEQNHSHESAYQDIDSLNPKQTDTDSAIDRRKIVARKVNPLQSPRNLMTANGPLMGRRNDKDIRKSLLEHTAIKKTMMSSPETKTQPMRAQPMRAQHDIASSNEPSGSVVPGRTVLVKKFNKQMWRPSIAGSEGSDQRPFSPFGGTLPPSKIVKKKVVEVFV